jgi:hypothetical protein
MRTLPPHLQPLRTRKRRIEAVSHQLLPTRREFWAERCAWKAATLKEGAVEGDDIWCDLCLSRATWLANGPSPRYRLLHASLHVHSIRVSASRNILCGIFACGLRLTISRVGRRLSGVLDPARANLLLP